MGNNRRINSKAFTKVGKRSVITVERSKGTDTYVDVVEGIQFDRGTYLLILPTIADKMMPELSNICVSIR